MRISWTVYLVILAVILVLIYKKQSENFTGLKTLKGKGLFIGIHILSGLIISWFIAGILLIPFNYYNLSVAKEKSTIIEKVEIEKLVSNSRNQCFYFRFQGKMNVIYDYDPIMDEIYKKKNSRNYKLSLHLKKGLLGSYLLTDWHIVKKTESEL